MSRAPSWLTWLVVAALAAVWAGERILQGMPVGRLVLTGGGVLLVLLATGWRKLSWWRARGDARPVERLFALCYGGCFLALALLLLAGDGTAWLGVGPADAAAADRLETALAVLGAIVLSVSLLPALAAQWAVGAGGAGAGEDTAAVDRLRVTQLATQGLTVGLALPFLLLAGWIASERDRTLDLSYFRTASPGAASEQIVQSLDAPLRVLLFFPPANEVEDQVLGYFRALEGAGGNVQVERYDLLADPAVAQEHGVVRDGTVVLTVGDRSDAVVLPTRLAEARLRLRSLDRDVQQSLMRVAREARTVYFTVGHGELNDPGSARATDTLSLGSTFALESLLGYLNYDYAPLGLQGGLGRAVPEDAAMVVVLGPRRPFLPAELQTLDRYLAQGGSLLLALDPESEFDLGPLQGRLGVEYSRVPLADDQSYINVRGNISDRGVIITNMIFSHAALPTAGQGAIGDGIGFFGTGSFRPLDAPEPRVDVLVRSMPTTFADSTRDFEAGPDEAKLQHPLVVAAEDAEEARDDDPAAGMRAVLFADSDMFADMVLANLGLNQALTADVIRWLGREEALSGETASEADIPIVHTRAEDVAWFYSTILGAPALVLVLGLALLRRRRAGPARAPQAAEAP